MNIERINRIIAVLEAAKVPGAKVEYNSGDGWYMSTTPAWDFKNTHYRVLHRKSGGKRTIAAKDWDGQAVVWVKHESARTEWMVNAVVEEGFSLSENYPGDSRIKFENCDYLLYSFTRKEGDWHPFVVEAEGEWEVVASTEDAK